MADYLKEEGDLVIATSRSRVLVRIKPDGTLVYGPEYTPDEAASVLWQTIARKRAEFEKKVEGETAQEAAQEDARLNTILYRHMEKLLLAAGEADLANQVARDKVTQLAAASTPEQKAQRTQANLDATRTEQALNSAAIRLVELGRQLFLRGAPDPVSDDPNPSAVN